MAADQRGSRWSTSAVNPGRPLRARARRAGGSRRRSPRSDGGADRRRLAAVTRHAAPVAIRPSTAAPTTCWTPGCWHDGDLVRRDGVRQRRPTPAGVLETSGDPTLDLVDIAPWSLRRACPGPGRQHVRHPGAAAAATARRRLVLHSARSSSAATATCWAVWWPCPRAGRPVRRIRASPAGPAPDGGLPPAPRAADPPGAGQGPAAGARGSPTGCGSAGRGPRALPGPAGRDPPAWSASDERTGALARVDLAGGYDAAARTAERCGCHARGVLGGVDALVQHPAALTHRPVAARPVRRPRCSGSRSGSRTPTT